MTGGGPTASALLRQLGDRMRAPVARVRSWGPHGGDALLYAASAGLAACVAAAANASTAAYRQWALVALGPYLVAAALSALCVRGGRRRQAERGGAVAPAADAGPAGGAPRGARAGFGPARAWIFLLVLLGATIVPLTVEVSLRQGASASSTTHVQPEVVVIDQAAARLAHGKDPYHAEVVHGHLESAVKGEPGFESFFPYLPLMAVFGLPSSTKAPVEVTDTRLVFSIVTMIVVGLSLAALRAPPEPRIRTLQVLTVLPTAALPLATGGDDMPVVAFLLLALVLAQRRRPGWSGVVLGVVSSMKFTAWPVSVLALFCAVDRSGRRAPGRMAAGILAVAGPVVAPFAASNPRAFFANVVLFPLGLSGVTSPAASNLPGHVIVVALPALHRALPLAVAAVGGLVLLRYLVRRPPSTAGTVATVAGWVMLIAIGFAPATRVGYVLYPINFFVWGWLFNATERAERGPSLVPAAPLGAMAGVGAGPGRSRGVGHHEQLHGEAGPVRARLVRKGRRLHHHARLPVPAV